MVAALPVNFSLRLRFKICRHSTRLFYAPHDPPPPGDDPLQPYAVCAALCAAGGGDGLDDAAAGHGFAAARSLAACRRHSGLHGRGPQRGDGVQPAGRSPVRRRKSPHGHAALAGRHAFGRQRGAVHDGCRGVFVAGTLLFLPNWLPLVLALPVLLFSAGYSYAKRFTSLAHFWLGVALMLAPVCAWIALRGQVLLDASRRHCCPPSCWGGGADLGGRLRHHLCLSGCRLRPSGQARAAFRAGSACPVRCGWPRPAIW